MNKWICGIMLAGMCVGIDVGHMSAQEFRANVEVNAQKIEGTNKEVFETLKESITNYMNETKFSDATFGNNERLECTVYLTISEYNDDRVKGDLQLC